MNLSFTRELTPIQPEIIFQIFGFNIANSTLLIFLMIIIFFLFSYFIVKKFTLMPNKIQVATELVYEGMSSYIKELTNKHPHTEKIFPIIAAIMIYFVIANIITIIPGLSSFTYKDMVIFRTPTSDFNTVIGVAVASILIINIVAVKEEGVWSYLGNFFKFKEVYKGFRKSIADGFTALIEFFVGILDIIGELAKIASLSFRLFGNIYAGEILAVIILGAFAYVLPALWTIFSGFIGILQGIVFASLVAVYYSLSVKVKKKKEG